MTNISAIFEKEIYYVKAMNKKQKGMNKKVIISVHLLILKPNEVLILFVCYNPCIRQNHKYMKSR